MRRWVPVAVLLHAGVASTDSGLGRRGFEARRIGIVRELAAQGRQFVSCLITRDGKQVLGGTMDGVLVVFDRATGKPTQEITLQAGAPLYAIAQSPDGRRVAVGDAGGKIHFFDPSTWTENESAAVQHPSTAWSVEFALDGAFATAGADGQIKVWDAQGGEVGTLSSDSPEWRPFVAFRGRQLLAPTPNEGLALWDPREGKQELALEGQITRPVSAAISPNRRRAVVAAANGEIRWWDLSSGRELAPLREAPRNALSPVGRLAYTPDGAYLLAGVGTSVKIFHARSGRAVGALRGHRGYVQSFAVSADARFVVTACGDDRLRLWGYRADADAARQTGFLGVTLDTNAAGCVIGSLEDGFPAKAAGLQPGDRILKIAGKEVDDAQQCVQVIRSFAAGDEVEFLVEREGAQTVYKIRLAARPDE